MIKNKNMGTVREVAYRLWQIRSISGVNTTSEQDWYDAERIVREEEGHEKLIEELCEKPNGKRIITQ